MIKNYFRILKKTHAHLQTILKTPVKFQKDRTETVGGVKGTKYLLKTRNHAPRTTCHAPRATHHTPRTTRHAPRPTENQKQCPSTFLRKGGGQKINTFWLKRLSYLEICLVQIKALRIKVTQNYPLNYYLN